MLTSVLIPGATAEQTQWLDELQRMATSTENAIASRIARRSIDILDDLEKVRAPTLVDVALLEPSRVGVSFTVTA